jgi:hypothetical protein
MLKQLVLFLLLTGAAQAAGNARIDRAFQGAAGAAYSVEYMREVAPERSDLAKHAMAGGAISTVVGSLTSAEAGWKTGVIVGAGKELVNDALLGRGHPQVDDFVVTAAAAVLASGISPGFATLVHFDGRGAALHFSCRF